MPEDKSILSLSWEDIQSQAKERGIRLTKKQLAEAFEIADRNSDNDAMMEAFWSNIDYAIDEVKK